MHLPHPQKQLAGCCWLPRIAAKGRLFLRDEMPGNYRVAFGSRVGIDGYFLRHFELSLPQLLAAIRRHSSDNELAQWFLRQPNVSEESISNWNDFAPQIGSRGAPGYLTRQLVKWFLYPRSVRKPVKSIFEAIIQDEDLPAKVE